MNRSSRKRKDLTATKLSGYGLANATSNPALVFLSHHYYYISPKVILLNLTDPS